MSIGSVWERLRRRKVGRVLALDFDGRHLRMVLADVSGGRTRIDRLVTVDMPEDLDADDAGAVGAFLGRALRQMHLSGVPILMNVPRAKSVFKPLALPPVEDDGELASMVRFQAQKELTFRPEEAVIDFALEAHYGVEPSPEEEPAGQHVLAAAVQRPVVEYYQQVAEAAGVRLLRLGLRPYANMRCVEAYAGSEEGRLAIVHLTAGEAEVDVIERGGLTFSRSADIVLPPQPQDETARRAAVADIVQETARSVQSYLAVERERRIERVLVAGGTGVEAEAAEALARRLAVPCEVFDPSSRLRLAGPPADASAFISALGLAVGQGDAADPPFDFLNPKRPPVRRDATRTIVLTTAAAVVLVVVSAFAGAAIHLYRASSQVAACERELDDVRKGNKKVRALAERVNAIEAWLTEKRDWLDQWAYLSATFPSCQEVYLTSLKTGTDGTVSLAVRARTSEAIDAIGERLSEAGYGFKPGQVTTAKDKYGYNYVTSAKAIVDAGMEVHLADVGSVGRPPDDVSAETFRPTPSGESASGEPGTDKPAREEERRREEERPREASREPSESRTFTYDQWQRAMKELTKQRPDKSKSPKAYEAWRERMQDLYNRRPNRSRRSGGGRSDTRYPNARY